MTMLAISEREVLPSRADFQAWCLSERGIDAARFLELERAELGPECDEYERLEAAFEAVFADARARGEVEDERRDREAFHLQWEAERTRRELQEDLAWESGDGPARDRAEAEKASAAEYARAVARIDAEIAAARAANRWKLEKGDRILFTNGEWTHVPARPAPSDAAAPEHVPDISDLTDAGNACLFEREFGANLRYCRPLRTWFRWDGKHWAPDARGSVERLAKAFALGLFEALGESPRENQKALFKHAMYSNSAGGLSALLRLAETEGRIPIVPEDLDSNPFALNVQNGIVDLRTGALRPHAPEDMCTKIAAAEYRDGARSAEWDAALERWTGGDRELRDYLQLVCGYAAIGEWREKAFWYCYGPPDGGKSAFLNILADVLGSYAATADISTWVPQQAGGNRGDLVRLRGARLVTTSEVKTNQKFDEAILKKITGGDSIVAAAKYQAEIEWRAHFALMFAANDRLRAREDDAGVWARLKCIPFDRPIAKADQDPTMVRGFQAPERAAAVLAWIVEGARRYLAQGGLGATPARVTRAGDEYREAMAPAVDFAAECLEFGAGFEVTSAALRERLESWKRSRPGVRGLDLKALAAELRKRGCESAHTNRGNIWIGVKLFEL
jgi:putative DNA primase/helicase